ncbi:MAG: hypothetical protein BWK80_61060, partial [Desulfobacteraceae bacterium IS3]
PPPTPPRNGEGSLLFTPPALSGKGAGGLGWLPEFRDLLSRFDLNAVTIWEEKQSSLSGVLTEQTINSISKAIDELEYDVALNLLNEHSDI